MMTNISVDDAMDALVKEAERHEKEHDADFCDDTRVSLVVFTMLHLGLTIDQSWRDCRRVYSDGSGV